MRSNLMRLLALLLAAALLLGGCGSGESDSTLKEDSSRQSSQQGADEDLLDGEMSPDPVTLSGSGNFTRESVDQVPEMAELHLSAAIEFALTYYMWWAVKIDEQGLRSEPDDFWPLDVLVEYAWYVHVREHGTGGYTGDGSYYTIPHDDMVAMVERTYTSSTLPGVIRYHRSYDLETDTFSFQEYTGYYVDTLLEFDLSWEDSGDTRTVTMYETKGNPTQDRVHTYLFVRGEDGLWRLQNAWDEMREPADIHIEGAVPIGNDRYAGGIFGSIGNTVLSKEYWDGHLTLYALDWEDFSLKNEIAVDQGPVELIPRGDRLFLKFERRVVVLDEQLDVQYDQPLPIFLQALLDREISYRTDSWGYQTPLQFFTGYDISPDLQHYAYATESGLFLYDTASGQNLQLAESSTGSWPGSDFVIFSYYTPRFTADGSGLYCRLPVYEGPSDYYYHNLSAGEGYSVKESAAFSLVTPNHSGMGDYFSGYDWEWSYYFGDNHYVRHDTYSQPNRFPAWTVGSLSDLSGEQGAPLISAPIDESYYYQFLSVLSDGRVILSVGEGSYNTHYYHTYAP